MKIHRWTIGLFAVPAMLAALILSPAVAAAQGSIVDGSVTTEEYGTFNGVKYMRYAGQFIGTAAGDFSVPFEIIAPEGPAQGNRILVLEPLHPMGKAGLDGYLTPAFLFERGFSYGSVRWWRDTVNPAGGYPVDEAVEVLHNFAKAVREDADMQAMSGSVEGVYATAVSMATGPLLGLLQSPGGSLLDFTFLTVPSWPAETFNLPAETHLVMTYLTESDLIRGPMRNHHIKAMRGSSATYRAYEVVGAAHASDTPWNRATSMTLFGLDTEVSGALEWSPVLTALFLAGHQWAADGIEPPPSTYIADAPAGVVDPVYQVGYGLELETGIARDDDGNAFGGIRLPDLAVGRGQYIAVDPASFLGLGLLSVFRDLQCEPLPDGSPRFADHADYVAQFTAQTVALVTDRFLLQADADQMISAASASSVGDPAACTPAALPQTGQPGQTTPGLAGMLAGVALLGAGLGLSRRRDHAR